MKCLNTALTAAIATAILCAWSAAADPDFSTPKAAAISYARALETADAVATKAAVADDPQNQELGGIVAEIAGFRNKLRDAASAKFGAQASAKLVQTTTADQLARELEDADVQIDSDIAIINNKKNPANSLKLRKVAGQWKVDLSSAADKAALMKSLGALMGDIAAEITDGKYKSVDEAESAMQSRMSALAAPKRATTQPAK